MQKIRITQKVICALTECRDIVNDRWLEEVEANAHNMEMNFELPSAVGFLPPVVEESFDASTIDFGRVEARKTLFKGLTFLCFQPGQVMLVTLCVSALQSLA